MTCTFAFLPNIGPLELAILLVIVILILGPKRIPEAFRSIGGGIRGFRDEVGGGDKDGEDPSQLNGSADPDVSGKTGEKSKTKT